MELKDLRRGEAGLISATFLFKGVDKKLVQKTLCDSRCRLVTAGKGLVLFDIVDYRRSIGIVLSGRMEVTNPASRRYVMNTLARGDLFGSADLYDDCGSCVTVLTAKTFCRAALFPRGLIEELMRADFTASENYIRFLTGRVRFLNEKIQTLAAASADAALAQYLLSHMSGRTGRLTVKPAGSLSSLADGLNIARASLYRSFEALEGKGLIRKNGREIEIMDTAGLENIK